MSELAFDPNVFLSLLLIITEKTGEEKTFQPRMRLRCVPAVSEMKKHGQNSDERLYEFCMDNRMYSDCSYQSDPEFGEETTMISLNKLKLAKGQKFSYQSKGGN